MTQLRVDYKAVLNSKGQIKGILRNTTMYRYLNQELIICHDIFYYLYKSNVELINRENSCT